MCLAIPGKIIEIKNDKAIVAYGDIKRDVKIFDKNYNVGDYVLVSTGIVIQKVPEKEAKEALEQIQKV